MCLFLVFWYPCGALGAPPWSVGLVGLFVSLLVVCALSLFGVLAFGLSLWGVVVVSFFAFVGRCLLFVLGYFAFWGVLGLVLELAGVPVFSSVPVVSEDEWAACVAAGSWC